MLKSVLPSLALTSLVLVGACSKDKEQSPQKTASPNAAVAPSKVDKSLSGRVVVTISVDWEGDALKDDGLSAMTAFRKEWENVPMTHFICPTYFTRNDDNTESTRRIKAQVLAGDEVGVHIHPWFSLVEKAGLTPKSSPTIFVDDDPLQTYEHGDKGFEVSIAAYSSEELKVLIATSKQILLDNGMPPSTSFRAGGYVAPPNVLAAARSAGLTVDSSATWPAWYDEGTPGFQKALKAQWPSIQELTQPYGISTEAGPIIEVPNTGGFAEFTSSDEMLGHLQRALKQSDKIGKTIYVDFGFHQESAAEFLDQISDALFNFRNDYPDALSFSTVTEVATAFQEIK